MHGQGKVKTCRREINRNMGCIEIVQGHTPCDPVRRLIETWDVLKSEKTESVSETAGRLIETWDVLKLRIFRHVYRRRA